MEFLSEIEVMLSNVKVTVADGTLVTITPIAGAIVDAKTSEQIYLAATERTTGNYVVLIDRSADYTLSPVDSFGRMNGIDQIQAIAIISSRKMSKTAAELDASLCKKPLNFFTDRKEAIDWLQTFL